MKLREVQRDVREGDKVLEGQLKKVLWDCGLLILTLAALSGSFAAAQWTTLGHDQGRSASVDNGSLSTANVSRLGLEWSTQLENAPLALDALTAPVTAAHVQTPQGVKNIVFVAGSSDTFFALDAADGTILWERKFYSAAVARNSSYFLCPNAINATPAIDTSKSIIYTIARDGKLYGLDLGTGKTNFGPYQFIPLRQGMEGQGRCRCVAEGSK